MRKLVILFCLFLPAAYPQSWTGILAPSRAIDWRNAGLPPTLPDGETTPNPWTPPTRTLCTSVTGTGNGTSTDHDAIIAAVSSCANGTYVALHGTFTITSTLRLGGTNTNFHNNVTLRGDGAMSTLFTMSSGAGINLGSTALASNGSGQPIGLGDLTNTPANFTRGQTSFIVENVGNTGDLTPANINAGLIVAHFYQCDNGFTPGSRPLIFAPSTCNGSATDPQAPYWCAGAASCVVDSSHINSFAPAEGQTVQITSAVNNGNGTWTITTSPGLYMADWSFARGASLFWPSPTFTTSGMGLEDITVRLFDNSGNIGLGDGTASWMKGVRVIGYENSSQMDVVYCEHCLVANNYFFGNGGVSNIFGIAINDDQSGDTLMVNNISDDQIFSDYTGKHQGLVYAYNYAIDVSANHYQAVQFEHDPGSAFILREGNQFGRINDDNTWGSHNFETSFRNVMDCADYPYVIGGGNHGGGFQAAPFARFENYIANVMGLNVPASYLTGNCSTYQGASSDGFAWNVNGSVSGPTDTTGLTEASMVRWGNVSTILQASDTPANSGIRFTASENSNNANLSAWPNSVPYQNLASPSLNLPCSMFMPNYSATTCTPKYNGGTGLSWWKVCDTWNSFPTNCSHFTTPPFPATGPDILASGGAPANYANNIPARIAFDNLPIDATFQVSSTITGSSWSAGIETLTMSSGIPASNFMFLGPFQLTGIPAACSPTGVVPVEAHMTGSFSNGSGGGTVSYALASNPGSCTGTFKWPDVRQFDERVFAADPAVTVVGFVSESSLNNTQFTFNGNSTALGTNPSGQTACPNFSYCVPFAGKTLAGNLVILPYTYAFTGAVTATASGPGTYTCFDGAVDSTTTIGGTFHPHDGLCFAPNSTAGADREVVTFGTNAVTNVAGDASQWFNVATSSPLDVHNAAAGTSSTTANAVSVTTTVGGDLIYVHVCRTGTPSTTSFTAGAGFTLLTTDIHDGCATEYQIQTTAGAITPTMTMGTASTYVEQVFAFKAAASSAGTAPSGMYMERMMTWSMPQNVSGNFTFQWPSVGNLLFQGISCGVLTPSSSSLPTDAVNTWSLAGVNTLNSPVINGDYYAQNANPNPTGLVTDHFTGTGDCTVKFYSFSGAPASPFTQWSQYSISQSTSPATITTTWNPNTNPSMWVFTGGQTNNTGTGVSTPAAGCQWTGGSYGGMNVNGPEPIDENNMWAVCFESTTGNQTFAYSFAGTNPNGQGADLTGFKAPTAGVVVPTVTTTTATNIGNTSASSGGNVTVTGGATITAEGVACGTSSAPTAVCASATPSGGTGVFGPITLSSLSQGTHYHYRAFATNSAGTGYGNDLTFDTGPFIVLPALTPIPGGYVDTTTSNQLTGLPNLPFGAGYPINPVVTVSDNQPGATICVITGATSNPAAVPDPTATVHGTCDTANGEVSYAPGKYPDATLSPSYAQYQVPQTAIAAVTVPHVTTTIKAIATQATFSNSAVATGTYTITPSCGTKPTISTPVVDTDLDGNQGIGTTDGLAWIRIVYNTNVPTDAQAMWGTQSPAPFSTGPVQDATGTTTHTIIITGLLPGISYPYGVVSHAIGTGGVTCGSYAQNQFDPFYGASPGGSITTHARAVNTGALTDYALKPRGGHYVTQGFSTYFAVDIITLGGAPPTGTSRMTMAITGEPLAGTSFNWSNAGTRATTTGCTNVAVSSASLGDIITQTNVCNDTNSMNNWPASNYGTEEIQLLTTAATPPGNYTLTFTVSGTGPLSGPTRTATWPITVVAANAPFNGVAFPTGTPSSYPPIPNVSTYLTTASTFGDNDLVCRQIEPGSPVNTIGPNNNAVLTGVSFSHTFGSWFYDGVNTLLNVDNLLLNYTSAGTSGAQQNWSQCREDVAEVYRDKAALSTPEFAFMQFTEGYYQDYLMGGGLHGQALDKADVAEFSVPLPANTSQASYLNAPSANMRNTAYTLRNYVHGVALGLGVSTPISSISINGSTVTVNIPPGSPISATAFQIGTYEICITGATGSASTYNGCHPIIANSITPTSFGMTGTVACATGCGSYYVNPTGTPTAGNGVYPQSLTTMADFRDYTEDHVLAQLDQTCLTQDPTVDTEIWQIGLAMRALIEYYNVVSPPDPRIPPAIKSCADGLYNNLGWQAMNLGQWSYARDAQFLKINNTVVAGAFCNTLDVGLIVPAYAWLYKYSGQQIYQQEGDEIFGLNATYATGNGDMSNTPNAGAQIPGGCYLSGDIYHGALGLGSGSVGKVFSQHYYWGPGLDYVALRSAPQFTINPGSVGVYYQTQGFASTPQVITLTNPTGSTGTVTLGARTITGTDAARFSISGTTCAATLTVGSAPCTVSIVFTPPGGINAIAQYGGTPASPNTFLNIPVTFPITGLVTYKLPLYGTGVIGTLAPVTLNPAPGTYAGTQPVTMSSPNAANICYQTVVNNPVATGNGNITGGGGACVDGNSTTLANNSSVSVATNTTFFSVSATAPGYADSVPVNPGVVYTITTTTTATLAPNLAFGNQNINTTSASQTTTFTNTGSNQVNVTGVSVGGPYTNTGTGTCTGTAFTLPVSSSCTFIITFTPTVTGSAPGTLTVTDNATGSPQTISLSGTGTAPIITWSSPQGGTVYNFGNVNVGSFSLSPNGTTCSTTPSSCLQLTNTGTGPMNVSLTITGANAAQFSPLFSTTCPTVLPAGSACTATAKFTPTSAALFTAFITETDSVQSLTGSVTLNGTGVPPPGQIVAPNPVMVISENRSPRK